MARTFPWVLRVVWAVLPLTAGPLLAAGLHEHSTPVQLAGAIGLWGLWAMVLVGTFVPHPLGLTALRLLAPAGVAAALAALRSAHRPGPLEVAIGLGGTVVATAIAFLPEIGMLYVNGPAYPNERRFPLRVPGLLMLGPLIVAWGMAVLNPVLAVLLLAARAWVFGGILVVSSAAIDSLLLRALHALSRRWVVFVPAGLVLHDPVSLTDPVLFERRVIETLRPAPADTDSLDLTQRSTGLALELVLTEKVPMVLAKPGNRAGEPGASARLLFTPTRPGAVLKEAKTRRITVG